jgi:hypothetical protein
MTNRKNAGVARDVDGQRNEPAPLCDELRRHLHHIPGFGTVLQHPLVYSVPYLPTFNELLNTQLEHKSGAVSAAAQNGNWDKYIMLHERPHRAEALAATADSMSDGDYWKTLAWVWVDSENISEQQDLWETLLGADRKCQEQMMDADEQNTLAGLPEQFDVYQGHTGDSDDGWSWTIDIDVALFFAHRYATLRKQTPMITRGTVERGSVIAYLARRGEQEILVNPAELTNLSTSPAANYREHRKQQP